MQLRVVIFYIRMYLVVFYNFINISMVDDRYRYSTHILPTNSL